MIIFLFISLIALFGYYKMIYFYTRSWNELEASPKPYEATVTVLVPFRDEAENLPALLSSFSKLNYPKDLVQFLFIDDGSSDDSFEVVQSFNLPFKKLLISLEDGGGKKDAIKAAWKMVESDVILHTDADCEVQPNWIRRMLSPFHYPTIHFVSGPVVYKSETDFFQRWLQLDFVSLIVIGGAHIAWGRPLICNGANLAYRRSCLKEIDLQETLASGDDVFLMQSIHQRNKGSVFFQKDEEAVVTTLAPAGLNEFTQQRLRWAGKNTSYKDRINTSLLAFSWLFNVIIVANMILFNSVSVLLAILLVIAKVLIESKLYKSTAEFFAIRDWYRILLYGQIFHILYMVSLPIASKIVSYKWKGRKLR